MEPPLIRSDLSWHDARLWVDRHFRHRLVGLAASDRYQLGDVARRLLRRLGVSTPAAAWQRDRLAYLLPGRHTDVLALALTGVEIADGLRPVASVRERLLRFASTKNDPDL